MVGGDSDTAMMGGCGGWVWWMVVVVVEEEEGCYLGGGHGTQNISRSCYHLSMVAWCSY